MLKRKFSASWLIILFFGIIYLIIGFYFNDAKWITSWLQVGGIALTLAVTWMIMLKNNDKIEETTKRQIEALQLSGAEQMEHLTNLTNKQIDNFVTQTVEITSRLEEVAKQLSILAKLSGEMVEMEKQLKQIQETKIRQKEEDLKRQQDELYQSIERNKPLIYFKLHEEVDIIFSYTQIVIYNKGGEATSISLNVRFIKELNGKEREYSFTALNLKRAFQTKYQTGRTRHLEDYDTIQIEISVWDVQQREYYANITWKRKNNEWIHIKTVERPIFNNN